MGAAPFGDRPSKLQDPNMWLRLWRRTVENLATFPDLTLQVIGTLFPCPKKGNGDKQPTDAPRTLEAVSTAHSYAAPRKGHHHDGVGDSAAVAMLSAPCAWEGLRQPPESQLKLARGDLQPHDRAG